MRAINTNKETYAIVAPNFLAPKNPAPAEKTRRRPITASPARRKLYTKPIPKKGSSRTRINSFQNPGKANPDLAA